MSTTNVESDEVESDEVESDEVESDEVESDEVESDEAKLERILNDCGIDYVSKESKKRPSRAVVAFSIVPNYPEMDLPVVICSTEDVRKQIDYLQCSDAIELGLIPTSSSWNTDKGPFKERPSGLMVWEGDINNPTSNYIWRRLRPGELNQAHTGQQLQTSIV